MTPVNPLYVAKECQQMAGKAHGTDSVAFQKAAVVMMGAMVVASVGGVILQLWKELRKKDDHERGHDRSR